MEAKLDGFRVYKVKNRGDAGVDRNYTAPVYIIGLPGDIILLNKELKDEEIASTHDNTFELGKDVM